MKHSVATIKATVPLHLVIIPTWVKEQFHKNAVGLEYVTDMDTLCRVLSKEDIASFLCLNQHSKKWLKEPAVESFLPAAHWISSCYQQQEDMQSLVLSHQISHGTDKLLEGGGIELFGPLAEPVPLNRIDFRTVELGSEMVGLIPRVTETPIMERVGLWDDLLYIANKHMSMEKLSRLPLFRAFIYQLTA